MKTKEEIYDLISHNPVFHLATIENGKPHCRGMLLFRADEHGIIFHTGTFKALYSQLTSNQSVELCFNIAKTGEQIRISGEVVEDKDPALKEEIYQHPSRKFLRDYGDSIRSRMAVYRVVNAKATIWTMADNLEPNRFQDI
jgi:pyridoxamine 5'-phosphate oxidase